MDNLIFTPVHVVLFFSWFNFAAEGKMFEVCSKFASRLNLHQ